MTDHTIWYCIYGLGVFAVLYALATHISERNKP